MSNYPDDFDETELEDFLHEEDREKDSDIMDNLDEDLIYGCLEAGIDNLQNSIWRDVCLEIEETCSAEVRCHIGICVGDITSEMIENIMALDAVKSLIRGTSKKIVKAGQEIAVRISNGEYDDDYTY